MTTTKKTTTNTMILLPWIFWFSARVERSVAKVERACMLWLNEHETWIITPRAGSAVVRIDPLRFLTGCRKRRLNQVCLCLSYILTCFVLYLYCCLLGPLYVLLVFVDLCSVFWLFWLSCRYLTSDWLERPLWGSLTVRGDRLQKAQAEECLLFSWFIALFHCFYYISVLSHIHTWYVLSWHNIAYLCWKCR